MDGSDEIKSLVTALEEQYEAYAGASQRENLLTDDPDRLPTAEELAAQFEQFLAQQDRPGDNPDR